MSEMLTIGKIVNTHGVRGELKIMPTTDVVKHFSKLKSVIVSGRRQEKEYVIKSVRYHKQFVLLVLEGVDSMDDAELLKNSLIKINKKDAAPLGKNEYLIGDLIGMSVFTGEGRSLGELKDILTTGKHDVYAVYNKETEKEILIPAIKQCIKDINVEEKRMVVELLKGLEDL